MTTFEPAVRRHLDGNRKRALDIGHGRADHGGALFLAVFVAIAVRLRRGRRARPEPGTGARLAAERGRRWSSAPTSSTATACVLATNVPTASLFADPRAAPRSRRGGRAARATALPELRSAKLETKLASDSTLRLDQAQPDAAPAIRGQPPRHPRPLFPGTRSGASIRRARSPRMSSASPTSTTTGSPASSSRSTTC